MIALAVFIMLAGSAELLASGSAGRDYFEDEDELSIAREEMFAARAQGRANFLSLAATSSEVMRNGALYDSVLSVVHATPCLDYISAEAGKGSGTTTLAAYLANPAEELAEGGDCAPFPPADAWAGIARASEDAIPGADGKALDALMGNVYVGVDTPPYFAVADEASGAFIPFVNGFALFAAPNALDAALVGGSTYVFAALDATSSQFAIIDMRDPSAPSARYFTLAGVDPYGESPQGYRVRYYGGYAYVSARYTAGPELHIFDVSDPGGAYEVASAELGVTLNDFAVRDEKDRKRLLYAASSDKPGELMIYDVTEPWRAKRLSATDLPERTPTHHPGESIALTGPYALIGRSSGPNDPDLFVYDVSDAVHPASVASADVGATVSSIEAFGNLAYLGTTKSGKEVQVWSLESTMPSFIASFAVAGLGARALDYDRGRLYAAGVGAPLFEALESL
jgi:hypothetical protein